MQNKSRNLFKWIFIVFLAVVLYSLYDMAQHTTAPWKKKKQKAVERPF